MTEYLDIASGGGVHKVANFENLAQVLAADALWLDQRWTGGVLTTTEIANITSFIATGRRVVMMGENYIWTAWNNQILGIVGGSFGDVGDGYTAAIAVHPLTAGVTGVNLPYSGTATASGGTALFDQNWATLWMPQQNVLTLLDINVMEESYLPLANNDQFARNVAAWISSPVPDSSSLVVETGILGLLALVGSRRREQVV